MDDVRQLLASASLSRYCSLFESHGYDVLEHLLGNNAAGTPVVDDVVKHLDMPVGHACRLKKAVADAAFRQVPPAQPATAVEAITATSVLPLSDASAAALPAIALPPSASVDTATMPVNAPEASEVAADAAAASPPSAEPPAMSPPDVSFGAAVAAAPPSAEPPAMPPGLGSLGYDATLAVPPTKDIAAAAAAAASVAQTVQAAEKKERKRPRSDAQQARGKQARPLRAIEPEAVKKYNERVAAHPDLIGRDDAGKEACMAEVYCRVLLRGDAIGIDPVTRKVRNDSNPTKYSKYLGVFFDKGPFSRRADFFAEDARQKAEQCAEVYGKENDCAKTPAKKHITNLMAAFKAFRELARNGPLVTSLSPCRDIVLAAGAASSADAAAAASPLDEVDMIDEE